MDPQPLPPLASQPHTPYMSPDHHVHASPETQQNSQNQHMKGEVAFALKTEISESSPLGGKKGQQGNMSAQRLKLDPFAAAKHQRLRSIWRAGSRWKSCVITDETAKNNKKEYKKLNFPIKTLMGS